MAIFLLAQTDLANTVELKDRLENLYPNDHYDMGLASWLVSTDDTAEGLSTKLGIKDGEITSVVIAEVASYHGRANPAIWSWVKDKWEG